MPKSLRSRHHAYPLFHCSRRSNLDAASGPRFRTVLARFLRTVGRAILGIDDPGRTSLGAKAFKEGNNIRDVSCPVGLMLGWHDRPG